VAAAPPPPNPEALLPPGPEKAVILEDCQDCHSLNMVTRHGGSLEGWTSRLVRMIRSGSMITRDQIPALAAYLAKALPERPRPVPPKR
jgi:mono/diheme cytochrome c family protein